jgi:aspartyl aminopeptidase
MGDRANFVFVQPNGESIVLYGHWAGSNMLARLADAVATAKPRWTDSSYATRIAISQLIGDQWNMETGWGLSVNQILDNEHKIAVVDFEQKTFSLHEEGDWNDETNKVRGMNNEFIFVQDLDNFIEKYADRLVPA